MIPGCNYQIKGNHDLCGHPADYVFTALLIAGIALLVIGGLAQNGHLTIGGVGQQCLLGVGGGTFGLSALVLLARACCAQ